MTGRPRERGGANSAKLREAERRHHSHSESKKDCYIDPETFEFELDASLYADDAALLFETREDQNLFSCCLNFACVVFFALARRFFCVRLFRSAFEKQSLLPT